MFWRKKKDGKITVHGKLLKGRTSKKFAWDEFWLLERDRLVNLKTVRFIGLRGRADAVSVEGRQFHHLVKLKEPRYLDDGDDLVFHAGDMKIYLDPRRSAQLTER